VPTFTDRTYGFDLVTSTETIERFRQQLETRIVGFLAEHGHIHAVIRSFQG
jgi:hypothetical protein